MRGSRGKSRNIEVEGYMSTLQMWILVKAPQFASLPNEKAARCFFCTLLFKEGAFLKLPNTNLTYLLKRDGHRWTQVDTSVGGEEQVGTRKKRNQHKDGQAMEPGEETTTSNKAMFKQPPTNQPPTSNQPPTNHQPTTNQPATTYGSTLAPSFFWPY